MKKLLITTVIILLLGMNLVLANIPFALLKIYTLSRCAWLINSLYDIIFHDKELTIQIILQIFIFRPEKTILKTVKKSINDASRSRT